MKFKLLSGEYSCIHLVNMAYYLESIDLYHSSTTIPGPFLNYVPQDTLSGPSEFITESGQSRGLSSITKISDTSDNFMFYGIGIYPFPGRYPISILLKTNVFVYINQIRTVLFSVFYSSSQTCSCLSASMLKAVMRYTGSSAIRLPI